jgi:hypothetical protein
MMAQELFSAKVHAHLFPTDMKMADMSDLKERLATWKLATDAERNGSALATAKRRERSNTVRFALTLLAPIIAVAITAATLWFQIVQFRDNAESARRETEETQWRDTIKSFQGPRGFESVQRAVLLKTYLIEGSSHQRDARQLTLELLGNAINVGVAKTLIPVLSDGMTTENISDYLDMARALTEVAGEYQQVLDDASSGESASTQPQFGQVPSLQPSGPGHPSMMTPSGASFEPITKEEAEFAHKQAIDQLRLVTQEAARWIVYFDYSKITLDIRRIVFIDCDLSKLSALKINLEGSSFLDCQVEGADFSGAINITNTDWSGTAWWRAKAIEPALLTELASKFPFDAKVTYEGSDVASQEEYQAALKRLQVAPTATP